MPRSSGLYTCYPDKQSLLCRSPKYTIESTQTNSLECGGMTCPIIFICVINLSVILTKSEWWTSLLSYVSLVIMAIILSILPSLGSRHNYLGMHIRSLFQRYTERQLKCISSFTWYCVSILGHACCVQMTSLLIPVNPCNEIWSELLPGKSEGKQFQAQFWEKDHPISLWTRY